MAHEVENAAYAYKPAWHGLGTVVDHLMTAKEALAAVPELLSPIEKVPTYVEIDGRYVEIPDTFANMRECDNSVLGVVGARYQILQNAAALDFMDDLVDSGEAKYEAVISLRGGRQVALLMRFPTGVTVGDDTIDSYACLTNSHDGKSGVTAFPTPVRVECNNMLQYALRGAKRKFTIRHTTSLSGRMADARTTLNVTFAAMQEVAVIGNELVEASFSDDEFQKFLDTLVPVAEDEGAGRTRALNRQDDISAIYRNAPDLTKYVGTKWGAFNAVSTYDQHFASGRTTKTSTGDENRWTRITSGAALGDKAFSLLTA